MGTKLLLFLNHFAIMVRRKRLTIVTMFFILALQRQQNLTVQPGQGRRIGLQYYCMASPQMDHMWKPNFRMTRATVSPSFIHKIVLLCFIRSVVHISTLDLCAMLNCMCKIVKHSCNLREMYVCGVQKIAF